MDRFGEWRPIEPSPDDDGDDRQRPARESETRLTVSVPWFGVLGATVLAVAAATIWLGSAGSPPSLTLTGQAGYFDPSSTSPETSQPAALASSVGEVVVDVQGAVVRPGLLRLSSGSRVGDAIAAAGGYSPQVDALAASGGLNLAELLADGAKIYVPVRGQAASTGAPDGGGGAAETPVAGGLVDVNGATAEQLETLPGIGPVTAAKIISAREEAAFGTVDELLSRGVLGPATFEKIRQLITANP